MSSGNKAKRDRRTPTSASVRGRVKSKPKVASAGTLSPAARRSGEQIESTARRHGVELKAARTVATPLSGKATSRRHVRTSRYTPRHDHDAKGILAAIVHSSDAAIISKTLDGIVTSWNASAEKIFGYTASEMIGKSIHLIAAPHRPREMAEILDRIRRGERIEHFETERRHKDGHIVNISLTVSPIHDKKGRIVGASKIAADITERKRTEAQLTLKSEQLAEFSHALGLAPAIVRTLDDKVIFWGEGVEKLYGWSADEAVGQVAHELLATEFPRPLPEIVNDLIKTNRWQGELQHTHKDGKRLIVASQWVLHRRDTGQPASILQFDWDMTDARRTRAMIEEREARLRSIFEAAPDALVTLDERGIIQSFSPSAEKLFGYAAGEVIGQNVKLLMPEPHRTKHDGYLERYLRTGEKRIIGIGRQVEGQRKDGTIFPMHLAVGHSQFGNTHIFSGIIHDLSARVRMEEELRRAQKMEAMGQLTGGIAHDFNNLLTVISGNLEILDRRIVDGEDRDVLRDAREASQLGAELAKRLLAFGRRQPLQPRLTDLNTLVGGMTDMLRRSLGAMIEIDTRLAEGLPMIMVDPGQIESALLNLSVNARDAMPKGGRLVIATASADLDESYTAFHADVAPSRYVGLTVTDTGTGMTPEVRRRAFEPFFTTKPPGKGTGLGLSMVYGFVKQSGGHVSLYSEPGLGTTVRIYLPAQQGEASVPQRSAGAPAPTAAGERVLLVEDDPRVRRVSVRRLKDLGYVVLEADSGPAALKLLDEGADIDVLFTDMAMPGGMTGTDLAQEVRRRRPNVKILLTSGFAEAPVATDGLSIAGAGWLGKPYSVDELRSKLRELLDSDALPAQPGVTVTAKT